MKKRKHGNGDEGEGAKSRRVDTQAAQGQQVHPQVQPGQQVQPAQNVAQQVQQVVIWLPFDNVDPVLVNFANSHLLQHYGGVVIQGSNPNHVVGPNDDIVVVAHGNGGVICSFMNATDQGYAHLQAAQLAPILLGMLPQQGYQGTITLWCCQA